jgi:hypothetical protein
MSGGAYPVALMGALLQRIRFGHLGHGRLCCRGWSAAGRVRVGRAAGVGRRVGGGAVGAACWREGVQSWSNMHVLKTNPREPWGFSFQFFILEYIIYEDMFSV